MDIQKLKKMSITCDKCSYKHTYYSSNYIIQFKFCEKFVVDVICIFSCRVSIFET